ncbi:MAG: DUF424 family protein [Candidatus Aenigmarchaeota archaeon]|nr:DUF424 family protein [Candidatus Aenigmarchaeota archaeon]
MFWSKVYRVKDEIVVAICDQDLLEKTLDFDDIKFHISKKFYGGEIIDEEKAVKLLENSTIGNLVGEKIVSLALKKKYIAKENIILISGIPHAQFIQ